MYMLYESPKISCVSRQKRMTFILPSPKLFQLLFITNSQKFLTICKFCGILYVNEEFINEFNVVASF